MEHSVFIVHASLWLFCVIADLNSHLMHIAYSRVTFKAKMKVGCS